MFAMKIIKENGWGKFGSWASFRCKKWKEVKTEKKNGNEGKRKGGGGGS